MSGSNQNQRTHALQNLSLLHLPFTVGSFAGFCARATTGHAAALPRAAMNSRRRIHPSRKDDPG
jgi:hypothetical protein